MLLSIGMTNPMNQQNSGLKATYMCPVQGKFIFPVTQVRLKAYICSNCKNLLTDMKKARVFRAFFF